MLTIQFEQLLRLFDPPFYVFRKHSVGLICDKFTDPKDGKFNKTRYVLTEGRCTCLGFIKTGGCKHLKMFAGDFSWIEEGIYKEYVPEIIDEIVKASLIPDVKMKEILTLVESGPEFVSYLEIKTVGTAKAEKVVVFKKLTSKKMMAIVFSFGEKANKVKEDDGEKDGTT